MSRADRAKSVLENEEFQNAFKKIEKDILNDMRRIDSTDKDGIQALNIQFQLLGKLTQYFALLVAGNDEKIAQFKESQKRKTGNG